MKVSVAQLLNVLPVAAACFGAMLLLGWTLFNGLRRGVITSRAGTFSRATQPTLYWFVVSTFVFAGLMMLTVIPGLLHLLLSH